MFGRTNLEEVSETPLKRRVLPEDEQSRYICLENSVQYSVVDWLVAASKTVARRKA